MKIVIIGANGLTGKAAIARSIEAGHQVVAYVRRPETLQAQKGMEIVKGELLDVEKLQAAMQGADAVLCCLGPKVGMSAIFTPQNLMQTAVTSIIKAMNQSNVKRIILLSAFGVGDGIKAANTMSRFMIKTMMAKMYEDKEISEQMLAKSGLDWTTIHPLFINDKIASGNAEIASVEQVKKVLGMPKVTRSDVAKVMIDVINDTQTIRKGLVISSKGTMIKKK